jgi:hypothetical protein
MQMADDFNKPDDIMNDPKYRYEKPEVYLECALVSYDLGDLKEALDLLRASNGDFARRSVPQAMSYWFYGCMQLKTLSNDCTDALLSWERSKQIFQDAETHAAQNDFDTRDIIKTIENIIHVYSSTNTLPPPPNFVAAPITGASTGASARATGGKPAGRYQAYAAQLKIFPFYGVIRAGDPAHALDYPDGSAIVENMELDGRVYQVYNLKAEGQITLNPTSEYFVMKVKGDSMNVATPVPILDGDAVLLLKISRAQDRDIVAGVIRKEDADTTLKRYRVEKDGKYLVFESDKTTKAWLMSSDDYIQGVLVAILKPDAYLES